MSRSGRLGRLGRLATLPASAVRSAARWLLLLAARDLTGDVHRRRILVVAPHPDDETLGCGALLATATAAGGAVTVVVVTDGARSHPVEAGGPDLVGVRAAELRAATAALGVAGCDVVELGLPDGELSAAYADLVARLVDVVRTHQPDDVFATAAGEPHPDHDAVGRAVREAVPAAGGTARIWEYPVWLWASWPVSRQVPPRRGLRELRALLAGRRVAAVSTRAVLARKRDALAEYRSQLGGSAGGGLPAGVLRRALGRRELFFRVQ